MPKASCPKCGKSGNAPPGTEGKRLKCPKCATLFVVGGEPDVPFEVVEEAEDFASLAQQQQKPRQRASSSWGLYIGIGLVVSFAGCVGAVLLALIVFGSGGNLISDMGLSPDEA